MSSSRQLAVIMFTDIAGYTSLMGQDENKAYDILKINRDIHKTATSTHHGRLVKEMGDGMLLSFATVTDALLAAMTIQNACNEYGVYKLRIGMHLGEVIIDEGDVFGDPVNLASRIQSLGIPGSILLSKKIHEELENKAEFKTASLGVFNFKNVTKPVEVFALINPGFPHPKRRNLQGKVKPKNNTLIYVLGLLLLLVSVSIWYYFKHNQHTSFHQEAMEASVAVLAFSDMSPQSDHEWFSDGLAEEILNELAQIPELKVTARTSSFYFKDKSATITEIAEQLGVNYVVEGSVRKSDEGLRVTAQLIRARDGFHIWSQNFERPATDLYAVQDSIAHNIAQTLVSKVTQSQFRPERPANMQAYESFLRGIHLQFNEYSLSGNPKIFLEAEQAYLSAIALDPNYATAYAGLAGLYQSAPPPDAPPMVKLPLAKTVYDQKCDSLLQLATRLNPRALSVLRVKGSRFQDLGLLDSAYTYFKTLYSHYPYMSITHRTISNFYKRLGLYSEAITFAAKALELDPLNLGLMVDLAELHYVTDFKKFEKLTAKCFELNPNSDKVKWLIIQQKILNKDTLGFDQLKTQAYKLKQLIQLALNNQQSAALDILKEFNLDAAPEPVGLVNFYRLLNMKEEALLALEKWQTKPDRPEESYLNYILALAPDHLMFDFITNESRFKNLAKIERDRYQKITKRYATYKDMPKEDHKKPTR